jgi:DNA-binding NtrC family response regulator/predicted hydrocarbon binding protein
MTDKLIDSVRPPRRQPLMGQPMPDMARLSEELRFQPEEGIIWLGGERMFLLHARAMGDLRREMIENFGKEKARSLLTRMGYACGARDAELAMRLDDSAAFNFGPQLHALEGVCSVETLKLEVDVSRGEFFGDFIWHNSFEDEMHIAVYGIGAEPVCWMQTGYACGFTSTYMGRLILYREIECRGMGNPHCRVIGKPAEEWEDADEDLAFLQPERFSGQSVVRPSAAQVVLPAPTKAGEPGARSSLVGVSAAFNAAVHMMRQVADTTATVLFTGESGVGKERFAQALHAISNRAAQPFVAVNCAAIPENLVEAELFGVEKGAFTGATESRPGRFERAHGGTLFLDEIGTLSLAAQGKLLRVIQEGEVERLGDTKTRKVDVRLIAATNVDLRGAMRARQFREDLFYRLNVFPVRLPPLRERRDDIPHLISYFLEKYSAIHRRKPPGFTSQAIHAMIAYDWPGNIRELENLVERGVILAPENEPIGLCHLFTAGETVTSVVLGLAKGGSLSQVVIQNQAEEGGFNLSDFSNRAIENKASLAAIEDALLDAAMKRASGNLTHAAQYLGITRAQMVYRIKKKGEGGDDSLDP